MTDSIPMMAVLGNHEVVNTKGYTTQNLAYNTLFTFPQNGPDTLKNQTYSFNYGNIHYVALDSQSAEEAIAADKPNTSVDKLQSEWLINDLEANKSAGNTDWTIVYMHKPLYCNRGIKSNDTLKTVYQPIFDKYHVDVVLNGHDHSYSRTYPMYNDSPIGSTLKGTVYIEAGRIGVKAFPESYARIWNAFFYDPQDQATYMTAEVNGTHAQLQMLQDGRDAYRQLHNQQGHRRRFPADMHTRQKTINPGWPFTDSTSSCRR